jgi:hypothetical protein
MDSFARWPRKNKFSAKLKRRWTFSSRRAGRPAGAELAMTQTAARFPRSGLEQAGNFGGGD